MGKSISRLGSTMCGIGVISINENKYIFHKQIGEGAFSYVDLIEDLKDGTNFALKRIICHDKKVFLMAYISCVLLELKIRNEPL